MLQDMLVEITDIVLIRASQDGRSYEGQKRVQSDFVRYAVSRDLPDNG
jgi:hypothetical protein